MSAASARPGDASDAAATLERVRARVRGHAGPSAPAVVFDLDDTIVDPAHRTVAILRAVADKWDGGDEEQRAAAPKLRAIAPDQLGWDIEPTLRAVGIDSTRLQRAARRSWGARFFDGAWVRHDRPRAGAVAFVEALRADGATIVYFTARDLPGMGAGTVAALHDLGFPVLTTGTALVMRPTADGDHERYKAEACPALARYGEVVAAFDNEPAPCNALRTSFPNALVVWVRSRHRPGAPPLLPGVERIEDFSP